MGTALLERDESAYGRVPGFHYRLLEMLDGRRIDVFDPISAKTTYYLPMGATFGGNRRGNVTQCAVSAQDQILGSEMMLNVRVIRLVRVGNDREWTRWSAPDFNCQQLAQVIVWRDPKTGAATGKSSYTPTSVVAGEPDASIFSIPPNYTEKAPPAVQLARLEFKYGSKEKALATAEYDQCVKRNLQRDPMYERYKNPTSIPLMARIKAAVGL
jgi:hypothetical protein